GPEGAAPAGRALHVRRAPRPAVPAAAADQHRARGAALPAPDAGRPAGGRRAAARLRGVAAGQPGGVGVAVAGPAAAARRAHALAGPRRRRVLLPADVGARRVYVRDVGLRPVVLAQLP